MVDSLIEQIKERIDIVEFIEGYIKLEKSGINYRALCPFHSEKTPSFFVSPTRQIWHCFGCNRGSSIFDFVMEIEGIEFNDALKLLAQRVGLDVIKEDFQLKTERQRLLEICEIACRFFEKQLKKGTVGNQIQEYLLKRGLDENSIKKWRLGYGPNNWKALSDFLIGQGYKKEEINKAGLGIKKEENNQYSFYDRFRQRIIFPIFNLNSQVIGFAGRLLPGNKEQDKAKYINTPTTSLYDKSRILYGLNFAKSEIRKKDFVILTEGYFDTILAHQVGSENVIAISGTGLTENQLRILKRYTNNLYISFDMDQAGDNATQRGIDLAFKKDFTIKIVNLPKDTDPAEIIRKKPDQWLELSNKAQEILEFYFQNTFSKFNPETASTKKEIVQILIPRIKNLSNKILQAHWVQVLAKKIKVNEEIIWEELNKISDNKEILLIRRPLKKIGSEEKKEELRSRQKLLEEKILYSVLKEPQSLKFITQESLCFLSLSFQEIFISLKKEGSEKIEEILEKLGNQNEEIKKILNKIQFLVEIKNQEVSPFYEVQKCFQELEKIFLKERLKSLSEEIQKAEENNNEIKMKNLIEDFTKLSLKFANLKNKNEKEVN